MSMKVNSRRVLTAAVDLDGVVYELVPALRQWIHMRFGRPLHTMPDPGIYDLDVAWDLPPGFVADQLIAGVKAGFLFWEGDAFAPGLIGLRRLKAAGHRVVLVSARDLPGIEDVCFEATQSWLAKPHVNAIYDELVLTTTKTDVQFDFLVDDYEVNVRAAHSAGRAAILLNRDWNANVIDLKQASWDDICEWDLHSFVAASAAA
jgi:hypothetical protein